jgi:ABC-type branched-subunit amino acid transport system substrate-binding protein
MICRFVALLILVLTQLSPVFAQELPQSQVDLIASGQRIYRDGVLTSGRPLRGIATAGVTLVGKDAACINCHQRSGYGSSEGSINIRSITGPALFGTRVAPLVHGSLDATNLLSESSGLSNPESPQVNPLSLRLARSAAFAGSRPRPAYDEQTLARAIEEGIDVVGNGLKEPMPRFDLELNDFKALSTYLKTLSARASPGVTPDKVHFSTVIQPGTDSAKRHAMVEVLQVFLRDRNIGMRSEVRREQAGLVRLGRTYREWVLHVWELTGDSADWGRQLEAFHQAQPVFAMISGMGNASWKPIAEFSERFGVPCIFPQTELPAAFGPNFYSVYLSAGIALEAQALAKFLQDSPDRIPVVQVYRRGGLGEVAADAFRNAVKTIGNSILAERVLEESADATYWQKLAGQSPGAILVLWLSAEDLANAQVLVGAQSEVRMVYLSDSMAPDGQSNLVSAGAGRLRLVYPRALPAQREARLEVVKRWMKRSGIALVDEKVQMNAYLAALLTAMEASHSMDIYSREFLVESLEHRVGTANEPSIYPRLGLGPGQRFASKGSYILQVDGPDDSQMVPVSDWIVP